MIAAAGALQCSRLVLATSTKQSREDQERAVRRSWAVTPAGDRTLHVEIMVKDGDPERIKLAK